MDIRGASTATYTPPAASGRSGSAESSSEVRKIAEDSVQERKEAERSASQRPIEDRAERRESPHRVDIRV